MSLEVSTMSEILYTVPQVADMLHARPRTVYDVIKSGRLRARKIFRKYLITPEDLQEFIDTFGTKTDADK